VAAPREGQTGRFAREAPDVSAADLLDRIESQAVTVAQLNAKLKAARQELAAEREARARAAGAADAESVDLRRELEEALERNRMLEQQVEVAWSQLGVLEIELAERKPHWWDRRRGRSNLPPAN
jgi:hypothetical protein